MPAKNAAYSFEIYVTPCHASLPQVSQQIYGVHLLMRTSELHAN